MNAKDFLRKHVVRSQRLDFGVTDKKFHLHTIKAWMNDSGNSKHRFDTIKYFLPSARSVLDLGSGCGTCVFYGLLHGYEMYGIDPEDWKMEFNRRKALDYGYPSDWLKRFIKGVGEVLPFTSESFDCITTYQVLEHVQHLPRVIKEMLRVVRHSGGIHVQCPDYLGTFEGHYRMPWLPLMPKKLMKIFLKLRNKPTRGLESINYTTKVNIIGLFEYYSKQRGEKIEIIDVEKHRFLHYLREGNLGCPRIRYLVWKVLSYLKKMFRAETNVNLWIKKQ